MADVFISYSKQDVADARMLSALLEANGYTVWWDSNLEAGERFRKVIASELTKARAVIVIWTKGSVASDWVQSEAGRAHRDHKLLPVRSSEIEYNDIPPPFENVHTLTLNQTEQILEAVAAQLAKPVSTGPRWKVLRYELLLWLGVIGGAITLINIVGGIFKLSAALSWVLSNWSALLKHFWQALLFFKVEVSPYDAELLTIGLLMTTAIFYATSRQSSVAGHKSLTRAVQKSRAARLFSVSLLSLSLFLIFVIEGIGTVSISWRAEEKNLEPWARLVDRVFVGRRECAETVKELLPILHRNRFLLSGDESTFWTEQQRQVDDCLTSASTTGLSEPERALLSHPPPSVGMGAGSVWGAFVDSTPSGWTYRLFVTMVAPVFVPFILYLIARRVFFPLELQVSVLSRRLWRTLILFGGILVINVVALSLEDWFKAIPPQL